MSLHDLCAADATKFYSQILQRCSKVFGPYLDCVMKVGVTV